MNAPLNLTPAEVLIAEYERLQIEGFGFLRNSRAEEIILQDVHSSAHYSVYVLQGRWPQFEATLREKSVDEYDADDVGFYLGKLVGDFSVHQNSTDQEIIQALDHAPKVYDSGKSAYTDKKLRVPILGETYSLVQREYDSEPHRLYRLERDRRQAEQDSFFRDPQVEAIILRDPFYALLYANHVLKHRWPELEKCLETVPTNYRWHSGIQHLAAEAMIQYNLKTAQRPVKSIERLIYSIQLPENIVDPGTRQKSPGAAYDERKCSLFPGSNPISVHERTAVENHLFWRSLATYRNAASPSNTTSLNLEKWETNKGSRLLGNIKGTLEGFSGAVKGILKIVALPVSWVTGVTFTGALADVGLSVIKTAEHGLPLITSDKEGKRLQNSANFQIDELKSAQSDTARDAHNLAIVISSAINATAAAAFESHYVFRDACKMLSDPSPAEAGQKALKFLDHELHKISSIYANALASSVVMLDDEFKDQGGRSPFKLRHEPLTSDHVLSCLAERLINSETMAGAQNELSRVLDILDGAALLLNAEAKLAYILFERSGRSDLPSDTKMLLLPHEEFKDVVKWMLQPDIVPYTRDIKVANRPARIADIHDELEVMSLLIKARAKTHSYLVKGVSEQLEMISAIKADLCKIEANNIYQIQLDLTLRSPSEYLMKLSEHVKMHAHRLEIRDGIMPALEDNHIGEKLAASFTETSAPKR